MPSRRGTIIVIVTGLLAAALVLHLPGLNGPYYWKWPWRRLAIGQVLLLASATLPLLAAIQLSHRWRRAALILLMLGTIAVRLSLALVQGPQINFDWLEGVVRSASATSYYVDAAALNSVSGWLAMYPVVLHQLHLHTQSKPPGPVGWYVGWIRLLGYGRPSAVGSAVALAVVQSLVIPAAYWMVSEITGRRRAGFFAAAFIAFCPATTLVYPALDPAYGLLTCGLLLSVDRVCRRATFWNALLLGTVLAVSIFCTYSVLTLGTFVAAFILLRGRATLFRESPILLLRMAGGVGGGLLLFYGLLWLATGFNPWATFENAWHNQHVLLTAHAGERPYPLTAIFDLSDFALGMGWVGLIAVGSCWRSRWRPLCLLCIGQPLLVAATGLLQSETFRVWNVMLPVVAIAAGVGMARWQRGERWIYFVAMAVMVVAVAGNMVFMNP